MRRVYSILSVLLAAASIGALLLCLWQLYERADMQFAVIGAVILLGLAQLASFASRSRGRREAQSGLVEVAKSTNTLATDVQNIKRRLGAVEHDVAHGPKVSAQLAQQVKALELAVAAMGNLRASGGPASNGAARRRPARTFSDDRLDIYLEPVVRLSENRTAYYRATLAVRLEDGSHVPVPQLRERAEREGAVSFLDLAAFVRAAPVIRRLQARKRGLGIFCSISPPSFADDGFIERLLHFLRANEDISGSLVIEVSQETLASLSVKGTEGLAYLAELGATFCLSQARIQGTDLPALARLGFHFIDIDTRQLLAARAAAGAAGADPMLDAARANGLSIIAADVTTEADAEAAAGVATLGRGPFFSPPRLVRHDIAAREDAAAVA